jgi:5-methyltetrahydrofolate--homocysteine methyltransferase
MTLLEAISHRVLLGDGAMGTEMQYAGLEPGGAGEIWNLNHPDRVLAIQKRYVEAGSDILLTNTFGASRIMLTRHGAADRVEAINQSGAQIAREAFGSRPGFALGDIGPFGGLMEPHGEIAPDEVRRAFREQARALVAAGVDGIIIETQTALEELEIALQESLDAGATCVIGSIAFDVTRRGNDARTMMGIAPEQAAEFLQKNGAHVAALNCGAGIDTQWAARIVERYRAVCDLPCMAQPNNGTPVLEKMKVVYKQTADEMAAGITAITSAGARIVGGCCGSAPPHIAAMRRVLDAANISPAR